MIRTGAVGLAAVLALGLVSAPAVADELIPRPEETLTLDEAVAQNKVEVEVSSLGGALGSKIRVDVRSKVGHTVYVEVAPGTVFLAEAPKVQNMTGGVVRAEVMPGGARRTTSVMVLVDRRPRAFLIESFCLDYDKPAPRRGDTFEIARLDARARRILQAPEGPRPSLWAFQCAIWMDRAGVSGAELKQRYRLGDSDIQAARHLLRHAEQTGIASIPPGLPADVRVEVEKLFKPDPSVRAEAVAALGRMGQRALPAIPLVQVNVDVETPGQWAPGSMPPAPRTGAEAAAALRELGLPMLEPLIEGLAVRVDAQGPLVPAAPAIPRIAGAVPGGGILADQLIANLKSPAVVLRRRAARLLGLSQQPRVVEPLIEALGDEDAQVARSAADSLARITGEQFGTDQAKWSAWWRKHKDDFDPAAPR